MAWVIRIFIYKVQHREKYLMPVDNHSVCSYFINWPITKHQYIISVCVFCTNWLFITRLRLSSSPRPSTPFPSAKCKLPYPSLRSRTGRGAAEVLRTPTFHSSLSSPFRKVSLSSTPVFSLMSSSQRSFCLLQPFTLHDGLGKAR